MPLLLLGALVVVGILAMQSPSKAGPPPNPHPPPPPPPVPPGPTPGPPPEPPPPPAPPLPSPIDPPIHAKVTTQKDPLRIRSAPNLNASTLGTAAKGSLLRIDSSVLNGTGQEATPDQLSDPNFIPGQGWYAVTQESTGISGFSSMQFLSLL